MTALSHDASNLSAHGNAHEFVREAYAGDSGATFYQGAAVGRDPDDSFLVKPLAAAEQLYQVIGVNGAYLLGDGTKKVKASAGLFERENSASTDEILSTLPLGWPLYAVDDATAALTDGGGTRAFLGVFGGMSKNSKPLVWIGCDPIGLMARGIKIAFVYGHADLTDADTSQDFTLYTLPGPCRVVCPPAIDTLSAFSGGGTGSLTMAIGADSDPDAIGDEKSIFTGGAVGAMTAGVLGYAGALLASGTVIKAQFVTDTTLAALTAGAVVGTLYLRPGS